MQSVHGAAQGQTHHISIRPIFFWRLFVLRTFHCTWMHLVFFFVATFFLLLELFLASVPMNLFVPTIGLCLIANGFVCNVAPAPIGNREAGPMHTDVTFWKMSSSPFNGSNLGTIDWKMRVAGLVGSIRPNSLIVPCNSILLFLTLVKVYSDLLFLMGLKGFLSASLVDLHYPSMIFAVDMPWYPHQTPLKGWVVLSPRGK